MPIALIVVGSTGLVVGSLAAAGSDMFPAHRARLKGWGAGLLVVSVALMGLAFPLV